MYITNVLDIDDREKISESKKPYFFPQIHGTSDLDVVEATCVKVDNFW